MSTAKSRPPQRAKSRFRQGMFKPENPSKVIGNPNDIVYRSGWEKKFMYHLDRSSYILKWGSEPFHINYISPKDNRKHKYYIDFITITKDKKTGENIITLIEVKPYKETLEPTSKGKKKERYLYECMTYAVNQAKWKYARALCKEKGWQFVILTENELGVK